MNIVRAILLCLASYSAVVESRQTEARGSARMAIAMATPQSTGYGHDQVTCGFGRVDRTESVDMTILTGSAGLAGLMESREITGLTGLTELS